jgi:hypothetical protein
MSLANMKQELSQMLANIDSSEINDERIKNIENSIKTMSQDESLSETFWNSVWTKVSFSSRPATASIWLLSSWVLS